MALSAAFLASACRNQDALMPVAAVPTPSPAIERAQLAPEAQQNPFKQYAPGLMARTVYKAEQTGDFEVEIWELLVGPGKKSEAAKVPGGAIAEVRSGTGVVTIGEKRRDLKSGTGFSIDDGEAFQFENTSQEEGLALRLVLIRSH
jgi:gentisate 1,2-dioxygenase